MNGDHYSTDTKTNHNLYRFLTDFTSFKEINVSPKYVVIGIFSLDKHFFSSTSELTHSKFTKGM